MKHITIICLLLGLIIIVPMAAQNKTYYIDPKGDDNNIGTEKFPFATLVKAQGVVQPGDIVYINEGVYVVEADQTPMIVDAVYHCVFHMNKSGEAGKLISYVSNPKNSSRPVFDLSKVKPTNLRVTGFYVTGSYLFFKGFDVVGVQATVTGETQSEYFRIVKGANDNKFENLALHDGKAIGFYLAGGHRNYFLNSDVYSNGDQTMPDNFVAGFKASIAEEGTGVGNIFEGCRASYNSHEGFDLSNCFDAVEIKNCWAFRNGYVSGTTTRFTNKENKPVSASGFKLGGYDLDAIPKIPSVIPEHKVMYSLSYNNGEKGFYVNHHLGGIRIENNTSIDNMDNFDVYNYEMPLATDPVEVKGYGHTIKNNLSLSNRGNSVDLLGVSKAQSIVFNNSFDLGGVKQEEFISLEEADIYTIDKNNIVKLTNRKSDGSLPDMNFGKLTSDAELRFWGIGCFASGKASDLDFNWMKRPTIVMAGNIASIVGPGAEEFTKIHVSMDGTDKAETFEGTADLSDWVGAISLKAIVEDSNGNVIKSISLKIRK